MTKKLTLLALALGFALSLGATCAIDDMDAYFTGKSRTIEGRLFYQDRCPRGHRFWERA